jgi:hypothetical protein
LGCCCLIKSSSVELTELNVVVVESSNLELFVGSSSLWRWLHLVTVRSSSLHYTLMFHLHFVGVIASMKTLGDKDYFMTNSATKSEAPSRSR